MDEKYWEGKSSLNEEKTLKNESEDSYFEGLAKLSTEKMKWEFADFMDAVEQEEAQTAKKTRRLGLVKLCACCAAAVAILVAGFFFLKQPQSGTANFQQPQFATVEITPRKNQIYESKEEKPIRDALITPTKKQKEKVTVTPKNRKIDLASEAADEAYVIVNGQPVYDQEEAEQVVLASLEIMTNNFQEGKYALEKVKYIHVEL